MHQKRLIAIVLMAAAALLAAQTQVMALPAGDYSISIIDRSSLFSDTDGDGFAEPEGSGSEVNVGDEQRTIFKVNSVDTGEIEQNPFTGLKRITATNVGPSGSYSGMLYDLNVASVVFDIPGDGDAIIEPGEQADIYKTRGGRYLSGGGSQGTWTDQAPSPDGFTAADTAAGVNYGGILVVYEDPTNNASFNFASNWREPGDTSVPNPHPDIALPGTMAITLNGGTVMTTADYFPSISDVPGTSAANDSGTAEPWLVAVLLDMSDIPAVGGVGANPLGLPDSTFLVESDFRLSATTAEIAGSGLAFGNIIGGSSVNDTMWNYDVFSRGAWRADLRIDFEVGPNVGTQLTQGGWQVFSDDPVQISALPEPATVSLLGSGLVALGSLVARRRRKA